MLIILNENVGYADGGEKASERKGKKHNKPGRDRDFPAGLFEEIWKSPLSFPQLGKERDRLRNQFLTALLCC